MTSSTTTSSSPSFRLLILCYLLPWLAHSSPYSCSSNQCVDFPSYAALVDHIHSKQQEQQSQDTGAAVPDDNDDEPIVVCLCGKAYQGSAVCPSFPYQKSVDDGGATTVEYSEMPLTITRSVSLHCATTSEPCLMDCPQTPVVVKAGGKLELIAIRGSFVWSSSGEETKSTKFSVEPGASLFVTGVRFADITPSSDQLFGGAISNAGSLQIYDSSFQNCSSRLHGGGIYVNAKTSSLDVRRTQFEDNTAPVGGAISLTKDVPWARIFSCAFAGNQVPNLEVFESTAGMHNETVDSNTTDSVFWRTFEDQDYEFCDNAGLNDMGCTSGSSSPPHSTISLLLIQLVWLSVGAFALLS